MFLNWFTASFTAMEWIPVSEAARRAGVDISTIRRWTNAGKLEYRRTQGGHRRVSLEDLQRVLNPDETSRPTTTKVRSPLHELPRMLEAVEDWETLDLSSVETLEELRAYQRWISSTHAGLIPALRRFEQLLQDELDFRESLG